MPHAKPFITAHMVVKNEDQFVYFAIKSILPFVDKFLITDTGSTDKTLAILRGIRSDKIVLHETIAKTPSDITSARQAQLDATKNGWIWIIDGDEVYPYSLAKEVQSAIYKGNFEGIVVRRYDLLGDIYHRQSESVGTYHLFGQKGHLVIRALNKDKIKGLHLAGQYPLEGYYDQNNIEVIHHSKTNYYFTKKSLFHAMYLKRSSCNDSPFNVFNRNKYKIETGHKINDQYPEVFDMPRPSYIPDPKLPRSITYELLAKIITPFKIIKRKYLNNPHQNSL